MKVLFVCLGNICRSPTAHAVFDYMVAQSNQQDKVTVDSAGTASYHIGSTPDLRSTAHAQKRGYKLASRARQFTTDDFDNFDLILAMDDSNYRNIIALAKNEQEKNKVQTFMSYCPHFKQTFPEVPDPYYDGQQGFETVLDIVEEGCQQLLQEIIPSK